MKSCHLRFSLLTLIAMPAMFAAGWWVRDRNYERDVYIAAEQVADYSGGIYIPELGMVHGGRELAKRMKAMSPEAKAEMARRLAYYEEVVEPDFDPPRPSIMDSLLSLFGVSDDETGEDESTVDFGRSADGASDSAQNENSIQDRIDTMRRMQANGAFGKPSQLPPDD